MSEEQQQPETPECGRINFGQFEPNCPDADVGVHKPGCPHATQPQQQPEAAATQEPSAASVHLFPNLAGGIIVERQAGDSHHHVRIRHDGSVEWDEYVGGKVASSVEWKGKTTLAALLAERDAAHAVDEQPPAHSPSAELLGELDATLQHGDHAGTIHFNYVSTWLRQNRDRIAATIRERDAARAQLADVKIELDGWVAAKETADREMDRLEIALADAEQREKGLRRLLFVTHPCPNRYGDDGEMQCNACRIDFWRDSPERIGEQLSKRGEVIVRAALAGDPAATVPPQEVCENDTMSA